MKDPQESLRKHREARMARKSEHIQPVLISAGPPKKIGILGKVKITKQVVNLYKTATSPTMKIQGSWKTTLFGAGGLATIAFNLASMYLDGDPATNPDWSVFLPAILASTAALFARDNNKSSQDVGLRPDSK
jgi:hypothetical protein